jgi:hypothetical protein
VPIGLLPSQLLPCNASAWVSMVNENSSPYSSRALLESGFNNRAAGAPGDPMRSRERLHRQAAG